MRRQMGYLDYFNERWYEFTGFPRDAFGDQSWEPILHPDDLAHCRASWYAAVGNGKPYEIEYRFWSRHEQRWRWFIGLALPVRNDQGKIVKWFGSCTDIDEQKRVEEELRHANNDLEQFAFSASHDLRGTARTQNLQPTFLQRRPSKDQMDGEALKFLGYIRDGAARAEALVHTYSRTHMRLNKNLLSRSLMPTRCSRTRSRTLSGIIAEMVLTLPQQPCHTYYGCSAPICNSSSKTS